MESLPFTSEGYNRAIAILKEKYGKKSEIVKAYVKEILSLPLIPSANARKIVFSGYNLLGSWMRLGASLQSLWISCQP